MSKNSDSDFSEESAPNEEDLKMQKLLQEWDEKDDQKDEQYVDSDEDSDDADAAKKKALLKKEDSDEESGEEESEEEEEEEEEDDDDDEEEEEEEEDDEEEEEEEEEKPKEKAKSASRAIVPKKEEEDDDDDDDDDGESQSAASAGDDDGAPIVDTLKKKPKEKKAKKSVAKITEVTDDDNEEDAAMKALLANWDAENGEKDDEDEEEDSDDDSEPSEREVELEDNVIDHIVLASSDLEEGMAEFEKKTGIAAVISGTIKGLGIKCARISFSDASYLEIIAPDPKGPGPIGELIKSKKIDELTPFHYAIRTSRAEEMKDEVTKFGYVPDHITMFGAKPDGTPRKWEMLYLYGHKLGGICPFFINWANSDHPCATLPVVGKLKKLSIRAPEDDPVHKLLDHVGVEGINIETGKPKISFSFQSPEGTVKFSTSKAVGFKFPGFEADVGAIPGDDGEQDAEVNFSDPEEPDLLPVDDDDDLEA